MRRGKHYPGLHYGERPGLGQHPGVGGEAPGLGQTPAPTPAGPRVIAEDYYIYTIQFQDLAALDSDVGFIQIEADSDFLIQKWTYFSDIQGDAVTFNTIDVPLVTVTIVDTGSGRQLMNAPIPVPSLYGDGRLPYILPTPKLFIKNSRINVNVTNFSTGTDYRNLWLNFQGKKIFTSS